MKCLQSTNTDVTKLFYEDEQQLYEDYAKVEEIYSTLKLRSQCSIADRVPHEYSDYADERGCIFYLDVLISKDSVVYKNHQLILQIAVPEFRYDLNVVYHAPTDSYNLDFIMPVKDINSWIAHLDSLYEHLQLIVGLNLSENEILNYLNSLDWSE